MLTRNVRVIPLVFKSISTKKYYASRGMFGVHVAINDGGKVSELNCNRDYDWGYKGKLPSNLAKDILADCAGEEVADTYYRDFEENFIACMPRRGFVIPGDAIREWLEEKVREA